MLVGGVDAATLVAALGAGPLPAECRWGRRPHRGATACRLLERDDRGVRWVGYKLGRRRLSGCVNIGLTQDSLLRSRKQRHNALTPAYAQTILYEHSATLEGAYVASTCGETKVMTHILLLGQGGRCVISWPSQDILSLRGFCARINYPFIPRAYLHCQP